VCSPDGSGMSREAHVPFYERPGVKLSRSTHRTEIGADRVAVIQSLLVTCRLQGVDPYTYLVDVLQRISEHPASQVGDLTPRLWKEKFSHNPMKSDLALAGQ